MKKNIQLYYKKLAETFKSFQDIRVVGIGVFLVVALMITWSGVKVIETNYRLQRDIARLQQENEIKKLKNQNMALRNNYLKSDEYLELEARKNLGLAAPGEKVYIVSKKVALSHTVAPKEVSKTAIVAKTKSNFNAWLDFFFHRQS